MNKTIALGAAALVSLLTLQPALAQSSASSALSSEMSSEPTNDNYGSVISSLQTGATVDVGTITDTTTVNFVTVTSIKANGNTNALDNALKKNEAAVGKLRTSIGVDTALALKLKAAGYTVDQVVAVIAGANGEVTVYIDDRG
jgi:hypothetical protein